MWEGVRVRLTHTPMRRRVGRACALVCRAAYEHTAGVAGTCAPKRLMNSVNSGYPALGAGAGEFGGCLIYLGCLVNKSARGAGSGASLLCKYWIFTVE